MLSQAHGQTQMTVAPTNWTSPFGCLITPLLRACQLDLIGEADERQTHQGIAVYLRSFKKQQRWKGMDLSGTSFTVNFLTVASGKNQNTKVLFLSQLHNKPKRPDLLSIIDVINQLL